MKEGIHPEFYQAQRKRIFTLKYVLSAIHSTPVSRRQREPMDVLISSTRNMVWKANSSAGKGWGVTSQPYFNMRMSRKA